MKKLQWFADKDLIPTGATFLGELKTVVDDYEESPGGGHRFPTESHEEFLYEVPEPTPSTGERLNDEELDQIAIKTATKDCSKYILGVKVEHRKVIDPDMYDSFKAGYRACEERLLRPISPEKLEARLREVYPNERETGTLNPDGSIDTTRVPHCRWAYEKGARDAVEGKLSE